MADNAQGFGASAQTDKNSEQIADLLDQVRDLMVEDGADPATAEALTNYARPATITLSGNLADLNRMGQIANQGKIDTPPGQEDIPAGNIEEAFTTILPAAPNLAPAGLQTPMGQIDSDGNPIGGGGNGGGLDSMTKTELQAEADSRGVEYNSGDTKSDLIAKLGG